MVIRRVNLRSLSRAIIGFAALLVCGVAAADPPARVARLANIGGAVSFSPAGEDEWAFAIPNRPLITGDRVWADAGARAELQIGSLALRLGSQTSVTILNLDDRVAQFQLAQGALNVRVRRIDPGQIDRSRHAAARVFAARGRVIIESTSIPRARRPAVAVRSGEGEVYGEGAAYAIGARQWYRFADSGLRDYEYDALPPADAFDSWTRDRDRRRGQSGRRSLCLAGRHRLLGPRRLWNLELGRGLWQRLGADLGGERLGALSPGTLELDRAVGLDLGRRRAVGLRTVPLRPLGLRAQSLVLGARSGPRAARLRTGAGRLCRWQQFPDFGRRWRALARHRLVSARPRRGVSTRLPRQPQLFHQRQRQQHQCQQYLRHQRLQQARRASTPSIETAISAAE